MLSAAWPTASCTTFSTATYTTFAPPGSVSTLANGVSGNDVVGYYGDGSGVNHGYLFNGTTYTTIDPPGSTNTFVTAAAGNDIIGYYYFAPGGGPRLPVQHLDRDVHHIDLPRVDQHGCLWRLRQQRRRVLCGWQQRRSRLRVQHVEHDVHLVRSAGVDQYVRLLHIRQQYRGELCRRRQRAARLPVPACPRAVRLHPHRELGRSGDRHPRGVGALVSQTATGSTWEVVGNATYTNAGVFNVTVTVTDATGSSVTTSNTSFAVSVPGILLLDPSGAGALAVSGNGTISVDAGGEIIVASTNSSAVIVGGNGKVTAPELDLESTTGTQVSGNGKITGTIDSGVPAAEGADPLASLAVPSAPATQFSAVNVSGNTVVTLQPGTYVGGIKASGNAKVTLAAGTYYLQGGGFSVTDSAIVTGTGVFIYNAAQRPATRFSISGNASLTLTAPASGTYQGIGIFQARASTAPITVSVNGVLNLTGILYAAAAKVALSVNASLKFSGSSSRLIAADLNVSGDSSLTANSSAPQMIAASSGAVSAAAQIPTAYGINGLVMDGTGPSNTIVEAWDDPQIYQAWDALESQFGPNTAGLWRT